MLISLMINDFSFAKINYLIVNLVNQILNNYHHTLDMLMDVIITVMNDDSDYCLMIEFL